MAQNIMNTRRSTLFPSDRSYTTYPEKTNGRDNPLCLEPIKVGDIFIQGLSNDALL